MTEFRPLTAELARDLLSPAEYRRWFGSGEVGDSRAEYEQIEREPITRLETVLTLWEQECFLRNAEGHTERGLGVKEIMSPLEGPFLHYRTFRQYVLRGCSNNDLFNEDLYTGKDVRVRRQLGPLGNVPHAVYEWNCHSRRVFSMSPDISEQLLHTDLGGLLWSDIKFPFEAYAMELAKPITAGDISIDFILIFRMPERKALAIMLLPSILEELPVIDSKDKAQIEQLINKKRWRKLFYKIESLKIMHPEFPCVSLHEGKMDFSVTDVEKIIKDIGQDDSPDDKEVLRQAARLVVAFCLYLNQIPRDELVRGVAAESSEQTSFPDITAITRPEMINFVSSSHPLTRDQIKSLEGADRPSKGGYEMRWHWRRGYYSRKIGEGKNPNAPKIVWHPPMEIRKDRKPQGVDSLPGGAKTIVS